MKCPRCQHDNRAQAKFCEQCAAPLAPTMLQLSAAAARLRQVLPGVRASGRRRRHPIEPSASSRRVRRVSSAEGDRRQATVLVADISGYTALCARLDAEQVQALLGRFYDVTDGIIANYGGHVIDHAGDATLAVFGAPVAHDNDGERAARAALDIHARRPLRSSDPEGKALRLHIGVASGEVVAAVIAGGAQPKYAVTGDAVNLAARLNALAQTGQTVISDAVWRSVSRMFDAAAARRGRGQGFRQTDRGMEDRRAAPRRLPSAARSSAGRRSCGSCSAFSMAVQETQRGLAVCVRGEAGIGKSRLIEELRSRAQSARVRVSYRLGARLRRRQGTGCDPCDRQGCARGRHAGRRCRVARRRCSARWRAASSQPINRC